METFPIHVFRDSFGPIVRLLNENNIRYSMQEARSGVPKNSSGVIELLQTAAMWSALAAVIVAFIKGRSSRKVIITTNENTAVHAEGLSVDELKEVLKHAKSLTAIETKKEARSIYCAGPARISCKGRISGRRCCFLSSTHLARGIRSIRRRYVLREQSGFRNASSKRIGVRIKQDAS